MTQIFLDTDVLVAWNDENDDLYEKAQGLLEKTGHSRLQSVVSTNILLETITLISQRMGKQKAVHLLAELRGGMYRIIHPDEKLVIRTEEIFLEIVSKNVSYSDCMSFAICRHLGIEWVFSFDVHFKQQGFKRIGIEGFPS